MRSSSHSEQYALLRYFPGDFLLETERQGAVALPVLLPLLGNRSSNVTIEEMVKPSRDDFPGLRKALNFLKFDPSQVETLFNGIGSVVNLVGGVVSIVGAVSAVAD